MVQAAMLLLSTAAELSTDVRSFKDIGTDLHKEAVVIAVLNGSGQVLMESIVELDLRQGRASEALFALLARHLCEFRTDARLRGIPKGF